MLDQAAQNKIEESAKSDENQPQKQIEDKKKDQSPPAIFLRGKKNKQTQEIKSIINNFGKIDCIILWSST